MLTWSSQYTTGVPLVDSQHKVLFEHMNRLEELAGMRPMPIEEAEKVIKFLDSYSNTHFHFEEQCMMRHSCPSHEDNKRAHVEFRLVLEEFKRQAQTQGLTDELLKNLLVYMNEWVRSHVLNIDVKLRASVTQVSALEKQA